MTPEHIVVVIIIIILCTQPRRDNSAVDFTRRRNRL